VQRRNTKWGLPLLLIALTFASTYYVGAGMVLGRPPTSLAELRTGWLFSVPLMAILLAHEFGHFFAGRYHRVDVSPPYFIPVPFFLLGTLGAVIQIRERIRSRNALLDIGAAGPLAGMVVAVPVIIWGVATSPVEALPEAPYILEGRSIFYLALLSWLKGPIPEGPFGQLDGGHVAYALLGRRQDQISRRVLFSLPLLGVVVSAAYGIPSYMDGVRGERLVYDASAGMHWLVWALVLWALTRATGPSHPPTEDSQVSPRRRIVGWLTLSLFVLLFMPSWIRMQ
jgi:membrane-associated protease RseP (regulator of RpoE activity)